MLFVGNFVFKVFPETHCEMGGKGTVVLFGFFSIMFFAKWFGRACLSGTGHYK